MATKQYQFKRFTPNGQRYYGFPTDVVRLIAGINGHHAMIISDSILEDMHLTRFTSIDGKEHVRMAFEVDKKNNALRLYPSDKGYSVLIRQNGNGYLSTRTTKNFGLPAGDYKLVEKDQRIFELAK